MIRVEECRSRADTAGPEPNAHTLVGLDPATGTELWRHTGMVPGMLLAPDQASSHGGFYGNGRVATGSRVVVVTTRGTIDDSNVDPIWGDGFAVGPGSVTVLDASDGRTRWSQERTGGYTWAYPARGAVLATEVDTTEPLTMLGGGRRTVAMRPEDGEPTGAHEGAHFAAIDRYRALTTDATCSTWPT